MNKKGILSPVKDMPVDPFLKGLKSRGIKIEESLVT
jgi:hypothetical protein